MKTLTELSQREESQDQNRELIIDAIYHSRDTARLEIDKENQFWLTSQDSVRRLSLDEALAWYRRIHEDTLVYESETCDEGVGRFLRLIENELTAAKGGAQ